MIGRQLFPAASDDRFSRPRFNQFCGALVANKGALVRDEAELGVEPDRKVPISKNWDDAVTIKTSMLCVRCALIGRIASYGSITGRPVDLPSFFAAFPLSRRYILTDILYPTRQTEANFSGQSAHQASEYRPTSYLTKYSVDGTPEPSAE